MNVYVGTVHFRLSMYKKRISYGVLGFLSMVKNRMKRDSLTWPQNDQPRRPCNSTTQKVLQSCR